MNYSQKVQDMLLYNPDVLVEAMCKDKEVFSLFYDFSLQAVILRRTTGKEQPNIYELEELSEVCVKMERESQGVKDAMMIAEECGDFLSQGYTTAQILQHYKEIVEQKRK